MVKTVLLLSLLLVPGDGNAGDARGTASYTSLATVRSLLPQLSGRVTVRATLVRNGSPIYVEDSTEGAAVEDVSSQDLKIGDQLMVTGWPEDTESGLTFRKASIRVLWPGIPVPPLAVTAGQAALGKFANSLVEVQGRLLEEGKSEPGESLKIESGNQTFLAHFDLGKGSLLWPRLASGSLVRLRGVCSIRPEDTRYVGGFALLLRSAEDIDVLAGPPWWSPWHLLELGLLTIALVWAAHVGRVRMMRTRFRAIIAERARVGHEMHDTLAQSFAGVAFQIQAAKNSAPEGGVALARHLDLALDMVRHSHSEAHRSIVMLRPQALDETTNLQDALTQSIERMTEGCSIQVDFAVTGSRFGLPLFVEDALYRVAQEAIANALRHGDPKHLRIALNYGEKVVTLSVADDGSGFDPTQVDHSGFGLSGIRQRIRSLHGTFTVKSEPGEGTQIEVEVPRPRAAIAKFKAFLNSRTALARRWRAHGTAE